MLPEPLLLKRPETGFVRHARGAVPIHRGVNDAFALEPELAALILGDAPVETLDAAAFEAGLADAVATPAINLRQGAFARKHEWQIDWRTVRRLAWLGLGILVVTLAIQLATILRYAHDTDRLEAEAASVAAGALPGVRIDDPARQLARRLAELRGGGAGYGALSSALFEGVRATPGAQLSAMNFEPDGSLRATVQGDSSATLSAVQQRIEAGGFAAAIGPIRTGGGQPTADITVRGQ
jgi:general secretion pathway protein L